MALTRILVVDDDELIRMSLCAVLKEHSFEVTCAADVSEALRFITSQQFDVLLSDLHMPGAGDGLTVISAMRHASPDAITLLLSAFPEMSPAANAILMQTDEILVKPLEVTALIDAITQRLAKGPLHKRKVETIASILERTFDLSIDDWYATVEKDPTLMAIPMKRKERCQHLPQLFRDLGTRLQAAKPLGTKD